MGLTLPIFSGDQPHMLIAFSKANSRAICQRSRRSSLNSLSISRPPRRSAFRFPSRFCYSPTKSLNEADHVRYWPILLQKSPSEHCGIEICNNRIGAEAFLNRCCALVGVLESLLRAWMLKILLQQNRPKADIARCNAHVRFWG